MQLVKVVFCVKLAKVVCGVASGPFNETHHTQTKMPVITSAPLTEEVTLLSRQS